GNFTYFDTTTHKIAFEHIAASGSLPPGFPATKIGDEYFWDGGLISNAPLEWVLDSRPRRDTLAFQVDLWNARGELPKDMIGVEVRHKEIIYSSRNRAATDRYQYVQKLRIALANLLKHMPEELRRSADAKLLLAEADDKVCNIVHLIYRARPYEGIAKDFEFSRRTMEEHWQAGYNAMHARAWPIPKCLSFRIGWKGYAHSIAARSGADIELSARLAILVQCVHERNCHEGK